VQACCSSREQAHHLPVSSSKAKGICFWPSHTSATLHGTASHRKHQRQKEGISKSAMQPSKGVKQERNAAKVARHSGMLLSSSSSLLYATPFSSSVSIVL